MSTATLIPISEYLRTSYEPDAEFVDGRIEERPMGEKDHNWLQRKLLFLLNTPACEPYFDCIQEQRVRVDDETVRVPDLVILRDPDPDQQVVTSAPLLCIEILSPQDTMTRTLVRARDLLRLGAPQVWIFDPKCRTVHIYNGTDLTTLTEGFLIVPETPITVSIAEVFSALTPKPRRPPLS
jgi:Uma2 family endonuclease